MDNHSHINKLTWRCHRGMLELDIILQNFLKAEYPLLSRGLQEDFEALLAIEDTELYAWLMGVENPKNDDFSEIIKLIKAQTIGK